MLRFARELFSVRMDWLTLEINITPNTHSIHHFLASWWTEEEKKKHEENLRFERLAKRFKRTNNIQETY